MAQPCCFFLNLTIVVLLPEPKQVLLFNSQHSARVYCDGKDAEGSDKGSVCDEVG